MNAPAVDRGTEVGDGGRGSSRRQLIDVALGNAPAEVVVRRLTERKEPDASIVVGLRRIQGKLMRRLRSLVQ